MFMYIFLFFGSENPTSSWKTQKSAPYHCPYIYTWDGND